MAKMKPRSRQGIPDSIPDAQVDSYLYWRDREKKHLEEQARSEAETMEEVHRIYSNMRRDMQSHIAEFYAKYAKSEQITLAEARQRVSKMDIEEYGELAARYVADKDFSDLANEQMRLYNATMKINRLEYLKATLGLDMVAGYTDIDDLYTRHLTEMAMEEQKRMSGILHMTNAVSPKVFRRNAEAIAKGSFKGATFSERIWTNQTKMKGILDEQLQRGLMQGKNPRALMQELRPFLKDQQDHAEEHLLTLLQTEMARVQTEAQKMSYEENGIEKYTFICNELDGRTCPVCKDLDGNMYPVKEMMAGENASPIHPRCRCSTAAYMDREAFEKWLDALESGDTQAELERNTVDYMGSANTKEKSQTPFGELTIKQFKKYEHDIWTEDNSRETRRTAKVIDALVKYAKELMPTGVSVPKIVIVNRDKLGKGRYGGYDYKTDTIYYPNAYESIDSVRKILESGYFGGTSPETLVLHETGHKDHWDQARRLYKENPKKYNSVEDAKHYLDDSRREALVRKRYSDLDFIVRNVSENADVGLSLKRTINEFQADYYVRQCQGTVTDELKTFLEGINHDALTK